MLAFSRTGKLREEIQTRSLRRPGLESRVRHPVLSECNERDMRWRDREKGKGISGTMRLALPWGPSALTQSVTIPTQGAARKNLNMIGHPGFFPLKRGFLMLCSIMEWYILSIGCDRDRKKKLALRC